MKPETQTKEKSALKILVNALSGIGISFVYLYLLFLGRKSGINWYTERIQSFGNNHLAIFLLFGPFLVIQAILLVRNPFDSWPRGLFRTVMEFFLYFTTTNTLWSLAYYISTRELQAILWIEFLPVILVAVIVLTIEVQDSRTILKREGVFALLTFSYLIVWLSIGFPTSDGSGETIYYSNLQVNMVEIDYWIFSMFSWLLSYLFFERILFNQARNFGN